MLDLGEANALAADRRAAALTAAFLVALALAVSPVAGVSLGASYPIFAVVIALAIAGIAITALLLWAQARVTRSVSLSVLAAGYAMTALVMIPYLVFYRGLWPQLRTLALVDEQTTSWLWTEWHLLFVIATIVYYLVRKFVPPSGDAVAFAALQRRIAIGGGVLLVLIVPPAIWIDGLPAFVVRGHWTSASFWAMLPIVAGGVIAIGLAFWFNRVRMLLDLWLAVACLAMVLDVLLSLLSHPFAVGWYASRINVLIATSALLIVLLLQTAKIYGQLASTAERLRSETLTDPLTGLINRRGFDRRVAQALRDCARSGKPVAMLMLDVDNFKVYNDTFGHQAGDECLRKVSDAVRTAAGRAGDLVARLGGEELAVIMPDTDVEGAGVVAERMRRAVQSLRIPQGPGAAYDIVTLSAGVSSATNAANTDAERLMNDADRALYAAKNAGRNRAFQSGRLSEGPAYAG